MVTWFPMRMSYLLSACKNTSDIADIKKEEGRYIMGFQSMIILRVLADLENEFEKSYLSKLDTDDALISEAYYNSIKFVENLKSEFKTILLKKFLISLEEDEHGNQICNLKIPSGNQHKIKLNCSHRLVRRQEVVLSKVGRIKEVAQLCLITIQFPKMKMVNLILRDILQLLRLGMRKKSNVKISHFHHR